MGGAFQGAWAILVLGQKLPHRSPGGHAVSSQDKHQQWGGVGRTRTRLELRNKGSRALSQSWSCCSLFLNPSSGRNVFNSFSPSQGDVKGFLSVILLEEKRKTLTLRRKKRERGGERGHCNSSFLALTGGLPKNP